MVTFLSYFSEPLRNMAREVRNALCHFSRRGSGTQGRNEYIADLAREVFRANSENIGCFLSCLSSRIIKWLIEIGHERPCPMPTVASPTPAASPRPRSKTPLQLISMDLPPGVTLLQALSALKARDKEDEIFNKALTKYKQHLREKAPVTSARSDEEIEASKQAVLEQIKEAKQKLQEGPDDEFSPAAATSRSRSPITPRPQLGSESLPGTPRRKRGTRLGLRRVQTPQPVKG